MQVTAIVDEVHTVAGGLGDDHAGLLANLQPGAWHPAKHRTMLRSANRPLLSTALTA
jgi:hypothetical protein